MKFNLTFKQNRLHLDCKELQPVHPKGNQSWIFIGKTDAEAETPILWPPDVKSWLIWKDPDAGKDWRQEEKGTTEDEMVGWHHWLNGHEFGWIPGVGDEQGGCSPWVCKESDKTEQLNWTEQNLESWITAIVFMFLFTSDKGNENCLQWKFIPSYREHISTSLPLNLRVNLWWFCKTPAIHSAGGQFKSWGAITSQWGND